MVVGGESHRSGPLPTTSYHLPSELKAGDLVLARILSGTSGSLQGEIVEHVVPTSIGEEITA
jgi:hypothetical protein